MAEPAEGFTKCLDCGKILKEGLTHAGKCYRCYREAKKRHHQKMVEAARGHNELKD